MSDLAEALVAGLLAGWGVAIPLGAIGVMLVDLGMRAGLRPAASAAAGVAAADFLYAALAASAGAAAAGLLEPHARALQLGAAVVLAVVAVLGLRSLPRRPRSADATPSGRGLFLRFLALTSVNPLTVAYFAALMAGLPAVASAPAASKLAFVVAAGAASLSWQLVLAVTGAALHRRLPESARVCTAVAGNGLVLALAAHMALAA